MSYPRDLQRPERLPLYLARIRLEWAAIHGTNDEFREAVSRYLAAREVA